MRQAESVSKPILRRPQSAWPEPGDQISDDAQRLRRLRAVVRLLDNAFEIPGTRFRIGLDAIVGLVPGLGDLVTTAASAWILNEARLLGVSRRTRIRMGWNIAVDFLVGAVPLAGDVFDAAWRANVKNLALIERDLFGAPDMRAAARSAPGSADRVGRRAGLRRVASRIRHLISRTIDPWRSRHETHDRDRSHRRHLRGDRVVHVRSVLGMILAIVAVVAGGLGMMIAASPRRRGGVLSLVSIGLGLIALVKAVLVAVF